MLSLARVKAPLPFASAVLPLRRHLGKSLVKQLQRREAPSWNEKEDGGEEQSPKGRRFFKKVDDETLETFRLLVSLGGAGLMVGSLLLIYRDDLSKLRDVYRRAVNVTPTPRIPQIDSYQFHPDDVEPLTESAVDVIQSIRQNDGPDNVYQSLGEESGLMVFSGSANVELAREVCAHLDISIGRMKLSRFADGEISLEVLDNVRSRDVYIFQSVPNASSGECLHSHIMELFLTISAIRRASAERITAVLPYLAYSRQEDLDDEKPKPLAVADMSRILHTLGVDRVVFVDHHAPRAAAFFPEPIPVTNLLPQRLAIRYLSKKGLQRPVVVATENTAGERAKSFWSRLKKIEANTGLATLISNRPERGRQGGQNESAVYLEEEKKRSFAWGESKTYFVGDVRDRDCVVVDDIIDSGIRVCNAVAACKANGARRVFVYVTHGVLSSGAVKRLDKCDAEEILMTNSIALPSNIFSPKFKLLNVSKLIAEVLRRLNAETSAEYATTRGLGELYRDAELDQQNFKQSHEQ